MQYERLLVALVLIIGFLWLRRRAKALDDAARGRALRGTILFLAPVLIGAKWGFERLPFSMPVNLALELAGLAAALAVAGYVFMTPRGD